MILTDNKIVDYINSWIEQWNEDYDLILPIISINQNLDLYSNREIIFEFKPKITSIRDYPVAYESTDEGAQGRTTFEVIDEDLIEVYDAMDNYATIAIYNL